MWKWIALFILRFRIPLLVTLGLATVFMGYHGLKTEVQHEFVNVIPDEDADMQVYRRFQQQFGQDGTAVVIGLECDNLFTPVRLKALLALTDSLRKIGAVTQVLNVATARVLVVDSSTDKLRLLPLVDTPPHTQAQADSLKRVFAAQGIYRDFLFNSDGRISLMAVSLNREGAQTRTRTAVVMKIQALTEAYCAQTACKAYYTGLPTVRAYVATRLPQELALFSFLAIGLTALALFLFYRSLYAVAFPLLLLAVSAVFTFGIIGLLGYKVTLLSALLPPIIIVLGIPPCIYMLSEYHELYLEYRNKEKALQVMFQKLGLVTLMINANTAFGFLTLYLTDVVILQEFGLVAFLATMTAYVITIIMIPGIFSLLPAPTEKHLRHVESKRIRWIVDKVDYIVIHRRKWIYVSSVTAILLSVGGIAMLQSRFYVVDDVPKDTGIYTDMRVMERAFKGVLPFEIFIDTHRPGGLRRLSTLRKMDSLQTKLNTYPEIAHTLSYADALKWTRQAVFGGDSAQYLLPTSDELPALLTYNRKSGAGGQNPLQMVVDSSFRYARITGTMRDVGSHRLKPLIARIEADVDTIFGHFDPQKPRKNAEVHFTGTSRVYLHANEYLIDNLKWSLIATFLLIGLQMWALFGSARIMIISLIPNLIPLGITAAMMGYLDLPLKPGSALIYELAFGIAIDNSIHYLAMYRLFRRGGKGIPDAVRATNLSTGVAIIYTSIVLLMGFFIFVLSAFSNTQFMGSLTSITLFSAMFSNLFLMPALLLDFDREGSQKGKALIDES